MSERNGKVMTIESELRQLECRLQWDKWDPERKGVGELVKVFLIISLSRMFSYPVGICITILSGYSITGFFGNVNWVEGDQRDKAMANDEGKSSWKNFRWFSWLGFILYSGFCVEKTTCMYGNEYWMAWKEAEDSIPLNQLTFSAQQNFRTIEIDRFIGFRPIIIMRVWCKVIRFSA